MSEIRRVITPPNGFLLFGLRPREEFHAELLATVDPRSHGLLIATGSPVNVTKL